jgi:hypothetical protein
VKKVASKVAQLEKKFSAFNGIMKFIIVSTEDGHEFCLDLFIYFLSRVEAG